MRAVVQRVTHGSVSVDRVCIGSIDRGLVILLGVGQDDTEREARWLAQKIANLRIMADDEGRMNVSLLEAGGGALVISQFTLYGNAQRGRRPSYSEAAAPATAEPLVERFCQLLAEEGVSPVETGRFGATMNVVIHNDGPVTLVLDTDVSRSGRLKT
ncbi:MAG: D-aminoacyl-tRNA deacylase [Anaerolineae bacterium]|jgi:D-tyrosyl-tRNA(Tyr) deacylase